MVLEATLLDELARRSAQLNPDAIAVVTGSESKTYGELHGLIDRVAAGLMELGLPRGGRVGVFLDKRIETVAACFGAARAGGVFVPVNPVLKGAQVAYILRDCNVRVLITSSSRLESLKEQLPECPDLVHVVVIDAVAPAPSIAHLTLRTWSDLTSVRPREGHRVIDTDVVAILYTSGSTGKPKGVVLSHRNMVAGAKSVASYLENHPDDNLVAALPLSFDAGFSQLTTAFHSGARVTLLNYLLPRDVLDVIVRERVTGITAVPPLYIQLAQLDWPSTVPGHLRYFANTGGRMPQNTLAELRRKLPGAKPFLMYGLTEAFRSTYLPPEEVDRRPDSIGKAIPNAEILVLREDGSPCGPNEPGELVHRGALVGMGYWNDKEKTAERYRPLPGREAGLMIPELAVFSGDVVRKDEEGFLYFVGRRDEMIKTSGYRVSPNEIEEIVYETRRVGECAAFGVPHPVLGQGVVLVITEKAGVALDEAALARDLRERMPAYMVPMKIDARPGPLPRNSNGKIDRSLLSKEFRELFEKAAS
jgi:acyl-CoA ligase (AMP-forming) (exosortase A-associated)